MNMVYNKNGNDGGLDDNDGQMMAGPSEDRVASGELASASTEQVESPADTPIGGPDLGIPRRVRDESFARFTRNGTKGRYRDRVEYYVREAGKMGVTIQAVAFIMGVPPSTLSAARQTLTDKGRIIPLPKVENPSTGMPNTLYVHTDNFMGSDDDGIEEDDAI